MEALTSSHPSHLLSSPLRPAMLSSALVPFCSHLTPSYLSKTLEALLSLM